MRNGLHATAQTRWYGDVGNTAALAEEVGTLGPMFASEAIAADYLRMALFSLWANDCRGLLWWCAYDQNLLTRAPYDWTPIERELGLIRADRSVKPVMAEFTKFRAFLEKLPQSLPPRITEAVCILSHGQEQWGIAYASFILAKQAGFDEAVFLREDGTVAEGSAMNIFMVANGKMYTPPPNSDILVGITRNTIIELVREEMGIEVIERPIARTELYVCDELFFTGTGAQVAPVRSVDRRVIGSGKPGPVSKELQDLYFRVVQGKVDKYRKWCTPVF